MLDYCIMNIRDVDEETIRYYTSIMSSERQKAIQQYPSETDRIRSVIGEMATRKLLSKHTCMPEKDILLRVGKNGKPLAKKSIWNSMFLTAKTISFVPYPSRHSGQILKP